MPGPVITEAQPVWRPNEGPQYRFVSNVEREVLFGGAAGGGKSDGLLMSAAMEYTNRAHRAILFRQSYPELKDLIRRSRELYPILGGRYKDSTREWFFRSGAIIEFGYLDRKKDIPKYKRAWNFIGFDELTHWADDEFYVFMLGRMRAVTGSNLRLRMRATTNPGGPGHQWVRSRWKIPDEGTASEVWDSDTDSWRIFIPSRITDNPYLAGTSYEKDMDALPEETRKMLKDGRWDVVAGAMFGEFDYKLHTCDPFPIGHDWPLWRGADDGFNKPACVLWGTKYDGRIYIVRELYAPNMTPEVMAERTKEGDLAIPLRGADGKVFLNDRILRGDIDPSSFNESGVQNSQGTGRGQIMNNLGCNWSPAQKGSGSRVAGVNLIHSKLKLMDDCKPGLMIFRTCRNLIRTLPSLPKDKNNPEDIDTESDDHAYDCLRYLLQYRQNIVQATKLKGL